MRKLIGLVIVAGLVYGGIQYFKRMDRNAFMESSKHRLDTMFDDLTRTDNSSYSEAACLWYQGCEHPLNDSGLLNDFDQFLRRENVRPGAVRTFEFVSSELLTTGDSSTYHARFTYRVNGRSIALIVYHKRPLEWADI